MTESTIPKINLRTKQRVELAEDSRKPVALGVHLIHIPTGFGYVVDSHAEAFEDGEELVVLRRSRLQWDSLYVVTLEALRDEEVWSYVGL